MALYVQGVVNIAEYLLCKFKFVETKPGRFAMYFDHTLPPAKTLLKAVRSAMELEGIEYQESPVVEITPEQDHNIKFLLRLFTAVDPVIVDNSLHYHFHVTRMFDCRTPDVAAVIAQNARYVSPTPMEKFQLCAGNQEVYARIHTALRKLCDSKITSAAWNAFQNLSDEARRWVCEPIEKALAGQYDTVEDFEKACKTACLNADASTYETKMIGLMYELFSNDDWSGYLGYLYHEKKTQ